MIALDKMDRSVLSEEKAQKFLSKDEYNEYCSIPDREKELELNNLLTMPINKFTVVNELYFRSKWAFLFNRIFGERPITLLEVASGDADIIPQSLSRSNPDSIYFTANMNKALNKSLLRKTEGLNLTFHLINDDAVRIEQYVGHKTVDIIAFQHGVNDVLQAILCDRNGIDTVNTDWMEVLPSMIKILQNETSAGTFENNVKVPFLNLIRTLLSALKDDGIIAISHYMFQLDLDWGYPKNLFQNMLPIIRTWLKNETSLKETYLDGFEPQWWLFLKK